MALTALTGLTALRAHAQKAGDAVSPYGDLKESRFRARSSHWRGAGAQVRREGPGLAGKQWAFASPRADLHVPGERRLSQVVGTGPP